MDYRTILVHLDRSASADACIQFATRFAAVHRAHLLGLAPTGIAGFIRDAALPGADLGGLAPLFAQLREEAAYRCTCFESAAQQAGVASSAHRIVDDEPAVALATQAMYADLAIVSQPDRAAGAPGAGVAEYLAMNAPCPVIVLPHRAHPAPAFTRVVLAWNASPEAAHAVRQALPLLQGAAETVIAVVTAEAANPVPPAGSQELAAFLERHAVTVRIQQEQEEPHGNAGEALLALTRRCGAGLLVMGCYGHSRFRELLLGGVSRTVFRNLDLPVLMAH